MATSEQKNRNFIQLYRDRMDLVTMLARSQPKAYDLFMLLLKHMDGSNALTASNVVLSEILDTSVRTVQRSVKILKDYGYICVLKSGTSNVYIVNPDIAWTSYGNQKTYCKFNSTVLLSPTENAEYLYNPNATNHFKTIDQGFIKSVKNNKALHEAYTDDIEGQMSIDEVLEG